MLTPRQGHAATLLADGRVLITGGMGGIEPKGFLPLRETEIFDPVTRAFTAGPMLAVGRYQHATLALPDGSAMVVGGYVASYVVPTAVVEIVHPQLGARRMADLGVARGRGVALALAADGSVHVLGGTLEGRFAETTDVVERWDASSDQWRPTGRLELPCDGEWFPLPGDRVLRLPGGQHRCCGSALNGACFDWAEEWDLRSGRGRLLREFAGWRVTPGSVVRITPDRLVALVDAASMTEVFITSPREPPVGISSFTMSRLAGTLVACRPDELVWLGKEETLLLHPVSRAPSERLDLPAPAGSATVTLLPDGTALLCGGCVSAEGDLSRGVGAAFLLVRDPPLAGRTPPGRIRTTTR